MNQKLTDKSRKRVLALSLGLALTGCDFFHEATDAEYVARAKEFLDKGDYRSSSIELKSALQKNPDNAEARRLLGESNVKLGKGEDAEKELRRAIELGVVKEAVMVPLAQALLLQGKNQQILDDISAPPSLDPKDRANLTIYRGDAWLALNKLDLATAEYEQALQIDPGSSFAKLGLARIAAARNEVDKALQLADEVLQVAPAEASAWSLKAEFHKAKGELDKAETSYSQAIEHRQANQTDRANRALVRIELKKFEEAAKDIDILKKESPKFFLTHFAEGYLKIAQNRFSEAQGPLEEALRLNERYPFTLFYLGLIHLTQNQLQLAEQRLMRFKAVFPNSMQAHQLLALLRYKQHDLNAARSLLMPVILSQPDDVFSLNLIANIEFAGGNRSEGLKYLQKVAELKPEAGAAKTRLGVGLLASGQKERGLEMLEAALEADPELVQPHILIALTYLRAKDFDKAREAIDRLKTKLPDKLLSLNLEAMWYQAQGKEAQAKAALEQALALSPGEPTTSENLARLAYKNKQFDEVRRLYEGVLKAHPKHALAQLRLSEIDYREGKFKSMEERLDALIQSQPDLLQPRLELARYWLRFGQPERSQALLEEVRSRYPDHPDLLAVLTEAQIEAKQTTRALDTAKALEKVAPKSAHALYLLGKAYAENNDTKNLRAALERSLQNDPKFLPARLAMVKLLALETRSDEALQQLNQLAKEYPEDAEVLGVRAWLALQQKQPKKAVESYRAVLAKSPSSAVVMKLAQALWISGEKEQALKTLEDWNQQHANDAAVHYMRSGLYSSLGKETDAEQALAKVLEIKPNSAVALNDLAWLIREKNPRLALDYAEKAYQLAPHSYPIIDTLGMLLMMNHQAERALSLIRQAVELAPNDPSILYHLAIVQEKNGLKKEAVDSLKRVLRSENKFPERREAEALMARLTP